MAQQRGGGDVDDISPPPPEPFRAYKFLSLI